MTPFLLGITGGIGSGKSSVSRQLAEYCRAALIDIDICCRQLLERNQPGWLALRSAFDGTFFLQNGDLDRVALRDRIFQDADARALVDALIHPLAREAMRREVACHREALVFVEIPLLYEAQWQDDVDAVLVVYARPGAQCCRVMHRDGVSRKQATQAIKSQMNLQEKARCADFVIDNSGQWSASCEQILALGNQLCERFAGQLRQESA